MLLYSQVMDDYYDNMKDYHREYHNFRYHCDPFYKERHKKYMKNWYLNKNNKLSIIKSQPETKQPKIYYSNTPIIINWS